MRYPASLVSPSRERPTLRDGHLRIAECQDKRDQLAPKSTKVMMPIAIEKELSGFLGRLAVLVDLGWRSTGLSLVEVCIRGQERRSCSGILVAAASDCRLSCHMVIVLGHYASKHAQSNRGIMWVKLHRLCLGTCGCCTMKTVELRMSRVI